jgi:hypothetical protein
MLIALELRPFKIQAQSVQIACRHTTITFSDNDKNAIAPTTAFSQETQVTTAK